MNSAHGSCRLRSWAVPVLGTGDAGWHPGGGLSRKTSRRRHHLRRPDPQKRSN